MFTKTKKKLVVQNLSSPKRHKGQRNFLPQWRKADDRGKTREQENCFKTKAMIFIHNA